MTTGALIAASAAAGRARRTGAVLDAFRLAGATAPERARPLAELGLAPSPEVVAFARQRVLVHDVTTDAWYLDEAAYIALRDVPPRRAVRLLLIFIGIALAIVGIGMLALIRTRPVVPGTPAATATPTTP
jgi:hypothetical protein